MKNLNLYYILLFSLIWSPVNATVVSPIVYSEVEKQTIAYYTDRSVPESYTKWSPSSEASPPLSVAEAIKLVKVEIKKELEFDGSWFVEKIVLKNNWDSTWFYVVSMRMDKPGYPQVNIPVYLDGIIPPFKVLKEQS